MARGPLRVTRAGRLPLPDVPEPGSLDFASLNFPGGKHRFMDFARMAASGDARLQNMVGIWDQLSRYKRDRVRLEDLCANVAISPDEVLSVVFEAATDLSQKMAVLTFVTRQPEVVKRLGQSALRIRGTKQNPASDRKLEVLRKDRMAFLQHSGFMPELRNTGRQTFMRAHAPEATAANAESSVPSFARDMESLAGPKEQVQRALIEAQRRSVEADSSDAQESTTVRPAQSGTTAAPAAVSPPVSAPPPTVPSISGRYQRSAPMTVTHLASPSPSEDSVQIVHQPVGDRVGGDRKRYEFNVTVRGESPLSQACAAMRPFTLAQRLASFRARHR